MTEQIDKATQYVVLDYLKEYMRQELAIEPEKYIKDPNLLKIIKHVNSSRKEKADKTPYVFITINPRPDSDLYEFVETVHKSVTKKWITDYLYAFEQRGTKDVDFGTGHHCHMLLYREGKRPSEISREFQNTFKSYIGNAKHIDIKYIKEDDVETVRDYILGKKVDDSKKDKCEADIQWRAMHELEPHYTN